MKVVFSANTCWYLFNFRLNTLKRFISLGFDVYVVAPADSYTEKLINLGCTFVCSSLKRKSKNPILEFFTLAEFIYLFQQIRPDLVFTFTPKNNIYCCWAGVLSRSKVVSNISGVGGYFRGDGMLSRFISLLYKNSLAFSEIVYFQNGYDLSSFVERGLVRGDVARLIPGSGVDLQRFKRSRPIETSEKVAFIYSGRFLVKKGILQYLEADEILKKRYGDRVEFNLVGFFDDESEARVKSKIEDLGRSGTLNYLGSSDQVENELVNVDCIVLPSFYGEGVPKSLLEAAALGLLTITTDLPGCRDALVPNKTGYLCRPKSVKDLVEKMEQLVKTPHSVRAKMSESAINFVRENFDENIVINAYHESAKELLYK